MNKFTATLLLALSSSLFTLCEAQDINTFAGTGTGGYNGDNIQATAAEVNTPSDMATDKAGNVYIADFLNNRIRLVTISTGIITTFAGDGTGGYGGDNIQATASEVSEPTGIVVDTMGNVYIADYQNQRVRKVVISTGIITTVAGTGTTGYNGDDMAATAAELSDPEGVSTDDSGNVYIADTYNYRIRKICVKTGIITTVVGNGTNGYSGDAGQATAAEIGHTEKIKSDGAGDLYVPDEDNDRVRAVPLSTGIINTIAGNGIGGFSGNGGQATAAEISGPEGVTLDALGNVYFAEINNNVVREVNMTSGILTRIAGIHFNGYYGDGGPAIDAEISAPVGLHIDNMGNMYLADNGNQRYRVISPIETGIPGVINLAEVNVFPNPNAGMFTVQMPGGGYTSIKIYDELGREVYTQLLDASLQDKTLELNLSNQMNGVYFMQIITQKGTISKRIIITK
jgi:hypothetical protein